MKITRNHPYDTGHGRIHLCRGCTNPFKSRNTLAAHESVCPDMKMGKEPFSKLMPLNLATTIEESVGKNIALSQSFVELPPTQPEINAASNSASALHPSQTTQDVPDNCCCPICKIIVREGVKSICCTLCQTWVHQTCLHMNDEEFDDLSQPTAEWFCARCRLIKSNKIKWGEHVGEESIQELIQTTYATIIGWKKNIFRLPRGNCGSDFIKELTRLINLFVNKTKWERLALSLVHIFIPLMLQKPSSKSKPREHTKYLTSRLELGCCTKT